MVVGARYVPTLESVNRLCSGVGCRQHLSLMASVTYIDVTQPAVPESRSLPGACVRGCARACASAGLCFASDPLIQRCRRCHCGGADAKLPADFFYPL